MVAEEELAATNQEEVVVAEEDREEVAATTTNRAHRRNTTQTTIAMRLARMVEEEAEVAIKEDTKAEDWMIEWRTRNSRNAVVTKARIREVVTRTTMSREDVVVEEVVEVVIIEIRRRHLLRRKINTCSTRTPYMPTLRLRYRDGFCLRTARAQRRLCSSSEERIARRVLRRCASTIIC